MNKRSRETESVSERERESARERERVGRVLWGGGGGEGVSSATRVMSAGHTWQMRLKTLTARRVRGSARMRPEAS